MIPITIPCLGPEEERAAAAVISSGWLTQGSKVIEFEESVARYCGSRFAVAVSNCTTALHLALVAMEIGPGDEVICPSMSFIATANAIRQAGATPVFADVDPLTFNLDPQSAEAAITPRTKAMLPVHQIGMPVDLEKFHAICDKHGLVLIEDAACAIGSRYKGKPVGGDGAIACFSFHPRKVLTTGEGGIITTDSEELAEKLRLLRQHGMSVNDRVRHHAKQVIHEQYLCLGYNYRMTDIQAAIGVEQMKRLDFICQRRLELDMHYNEKLANHPWLRTPFVPEYAQPNYQSYAVALSDEAPIERNALMQWLLERQIATRRGIMLIHREAPYADGHYHLPNSEKASDRSLLLPIYPTLTHQQQTEVIDALWKITEEQTVREIHSRAA